MRKVKKLVREEEEYPVTALPFDGGGGVVAQRVADFSNGIVTKIPASEVKPLEEYGKSIVTEITAGQFNKSGISIGQQDKYLTSKNNPTFDEKPGVMNRPVPGQISKQDKWQSQVNDPNFDKKVGMGTLIIDWIRRMFLSLGWVLGSIITSIFNAITTALSKAYKFIRGLFTGTNTWVHVTKFAGLTVATWMVWGAIAASVAFIIYRLVKWLKARKAGTVTEMTLAELESYLVADLKIIRESDETVSPMMQNGAKNILKAQQEVDETPKTKFWNIMKKIVYVLLGCIGIYAAIMGIKWAKAGPGKVFALPSDSNDRQKSIPLARHDVPSDGGGRQVSVPTATGSTIPWNLPSDGSERQKSRSFNKAPNMDGTF